MYISRQKADFTFLKKLLQTPLSFKVIQGCPNPVDVLLLPLHIRTDTVNAFI